VEGRSVETPQSESEATYAHKIEKKDGIIDWSHPARDIHNQIRGLYPWPHAFSELDGERVIFLESDVALETSPSNAAPGTIITAHRDDLTVTTGDGRLRVLALQREGRRPMATREFLAGRRIEAGTVFRQPRSSI